MRPWIPVVHGASDQRPDERDAIDTAVAIAAALKRLGYDSDIVPVDRNLTAIPELAARSPLAVFNLIEALDGDGQLGVLGCTAMQRAGLHFTGCGPSAYLQSSSKLLGKRLFNEHAIPTPGYWTGPAPAGQTVIVKSVWEHASFGIDQASVVDGVLAADEICRRQAQFGGQFFAEAYVPGREFNVAVIEQADGPRVLPIAEMCFDQLPPSVLPIVDYQAKWDETSVGYQNMERRFGVQANEPDLAARIAALCQRCWYAAGLRGYARIDLRVDHDSNLQVLEFNANPCLAPDAGFMAAASQAGMGFDAVVAAIVNVALSVKIHACFESDS